jgi:hypothetical protein
MGVLNLQAKLCVVSMVIIDMIPYQEIAVVKIGSGWWHSAKPADNE